VSTTGSELGELMAAAWDTATLAQVQHSAFETVDSFERFRSAHAQMERDALTGTGDVAALAFKVGLGHLMLGQHGSAIEWLSKASPSPLRDLYLGRAQREMGRHDDALASFERAGGAGAERLEIAAERAEALILRGDSAAAEAELSKTESAGARSGAWQYARGRLEEARGDFTAALERYERAVEQDPENGRAWFRMAFVNDLHGNDDDALEQYERSTNLPVVRANALMNLAVIFEDRGEYARARQCLLRVLATNPNHARARLFLKDVDASEYMVIDEDQERLRLQQAAVMDTPVSEFELSVRARNCLKKMNINTLGDLLRISEAELLAYKNFGETSLTEIKAMLTQKNLRLGQFADPTARPRMDPRRVSIVGNPEVLNRPVAELELSVRSRKCLQRLNITTVAELCSRTEQELLATRNFGQTSLNELKRRLTELGVSLRASGG